MNTTIYSVNTRLIYQSTDTQYKVKTLEIFIPWLTFCIQFD